MRIKSIVVYTTGDAARILGVSPKTVTARAHEEGVGVTGGRTTFFTGAEILRIWRDPYNDRPGKRPREKRTLEEVKRELKEREAT